jgi:hypothetical protein
MPDRILRTEERPLSEEDLVLLKEKKKSRSYIYFQAIYLLSPVAFTYFFSVPIALTMAAMS